MERPKEIDKEYIERDHMTIDDYNLIRNNNDVKKYIEYLELRIQRLTEGLDDMITTLQNMQRNGRDK